MGWLCSLDLVRWRGVGCLGCIVRPNIETSIVMATICICWGRCLSARSGCGLIGLNRCICTVDWWILRSANDVGREIGGCWTLRVWRIGWLWLNCHNEGMGDCPNFLRQLSQWWSWEWGVRNEEWGVRNEEWGMGSEECKKGWAKIGSAFGGVLLCVVL